jgi:hypothetical protein
MNQQEATDFVIQQLGKHQQKNNIIQKLCESTSMNWGQAEKFIQQVEAQHGGIIAQKQSPMIAAIGTVTVIAGFAIAIGIIVVTLQGWMIFFLKLPVPYLGNIVYFLGGVAMIAGGLRGTWDTIVRMWNS